MNNPIQDLDIGPTNWTLDSGSSYHMINDLDSLYEVVNHKEIISFADGGQIVPIHRNTYKNYLNDNKMILHNVLCTSNKLCTVTSNNNKTIIICDSLTKVDDNMELWLRRLGHFNNIDCIKDDLNKIIIDYKYTVSSPDSSIYGNNCFLTILDDYTRYFWVLFLKNKGYDDINHTAYRIYDPSNNKIFLSRSVYFFEDNSSNAPANTIPELINIAEFY
ncbi:hypothetical protein PIROE2DRAFT_1218 [Piromyces sp. E2]|nr:hypothetical protein PIROE2DRAFT_1218 [Piromyces sp. E2]|eukprot:OUM70677.1 hypothetical protein PIROE2DRAFT_1218 [Piromyces sp. E2]